MHVDMTPPPIQRPRHGSSSGSRCVCAIRLIGISAHCLVTLTSCCSKLVPVSENRPTTVKRDLLIDLRNVSLSFSLSLPPSLSAYPLRVALCAEQERQQTGREASHHWCCRLCAVYVQQQQSRQWSTSACEVAAAALAPRLHLHPPPPPASVPVPVVAAAAAHVPPPPALPPPPHGEEHDGSVGDGRGPVAPAASAAVLRAAM